MRATLPAMMEAQLPTGDDRWRWHLLRALLLAVAVVLLAQWSFDAFHEVNPRMFDGVMYEYKQMQTYDRFEGDFSWRSRYSRAVYELNGTPNDGLYTAFLCLLAPQWLLTGTGNTVRAGLALFFLLLSLSLWLRARVHGVGMSLILASICAIPALVSPFFGVGTYMPDIPAVLLITSGVLLLLTYAEIGGRPAYLFLALLCLVLAIGSRLNMFVYVGALLLLAAPLLWQVLRALHEGRRSSRLYGSLVLLSLFLLGMVAYVVPRLDWFFMYYNDTAYGQEDLLGSISIALDLMYRANGLLGVSIVFIIPAIYLAFRENDRPTVWKWWGLMLPAAPFLLVYGIPVLVKRLPNNPHVLNSAFVVLPLFLLALVLLLSSRFKLPDLTRFRMPLGVLVVALMLTSFVWQHSTVKSYKKPTPYNAATAFLIDFLEQEYPDGPPAFIAFHDDLVHIPVEVHFRKKYGYRFSNLPTFITKPSLMKCVDVETCMAHYLEVLDEVDVVMVNDLEANRSLLMGAYAVASEVSTAVFVKLTLEGSGFLEKERFTTSTHGEVVIFQREVVDRLHSSIIE
jgi:hypothetical protein